MEEVVQTSAQPNKLEENWRNPDGTWKEGHPSTGKRPKGKTLKEFAREWLLLKSDKDKMQFLKNLDPHFVWRMAEGNPPESIEHRGEVNHIFYLPIQLLAKHDLPRLPDPNSD